MRKQRNPINNLDKIIKAVAEIPAPKNKFNLQELVKFKYEYHEPSGSEKYLTNFIDDKNHPLGSFIHIPDVLLAVLGENEKGEIQAMHETPEGFFYAVRYLDKENNEGTLIFPEDFLLKVDEPWPQNENY